MDEPQSPLQDYDASSSPERHAGGPGKFFGALVGVLTGAVSGGICCWLVDRPAWQWHGAAVAAGLGLLLGAFLGARQGRRAYSESPNIATTICTGYMLLPGALLLIGGGGALRWNWAGKFVLGVAFAFPMAGLLVGALLDRFYEKVFWRNDH